MDDLKVIIKQLAREAVENYILKGEVINSGPKHPFLEQKSASFVSLKIYGKLRGCIGTIEPQEDCLAKEIIKNAIDASTKDYRFTPVRPAELVNLQYSVDVLSNLTPVKTTDELDPKKFGIVVQRQFARGLLLPDLKGVDTVSQQIEIAKQKASIFDNKGLELFKFEVTRF